VRKQLISLAILALMPFAAQAQEDEDSPFSWSAAATSEYLFRGISQTDDHPALQGSVGYSFSNGLYVGAWASNVDFGAADTETDAEIDTYVGWNGDLSDSANLDVQLVRYNYVGEPDGVDYAYNELITKVTFVETYSVTLGYTNDYLNTSSDSFYGAVGGSWDVGGGYNLTAGLGYTTIQGPTDGYADYSVGVNKDFGPVNIAVGYVGTDSEAEDLFGKDNTEDRAVVTFTFGG
jgi:uncharacterized protein (TIGR02001 family)